MESISIVVYEHATDTTPYAVLTGDTLFIGDVGRPDLLSSVGISAEELAAKLYHSVHDKLLTLPDPGADTLTVHITYLVGSRHEGYGEKGMAHLLEHLLFRGSKRHPSVKQEFTQRGARWNGTTSNDRTNYFETLAATDDNLQWAIAMEADRMVNSFVSKADLDSEMTVVRNEFELGENNPGQVLFQRMQENRRARGAKLVVIDPRRTATAEEADLHLAVAPGMDTALFSGLLVRLADHGVFDRAFVTQHTTGFEDALKRAAELAPDLETVANLVRMTVSGQ